MIPWVREKFAERRAKWLARRRNSTHNKDEEDDEDSASTNVRVPRLQDNPEEVLASNHQAAHAVAHQRCSAPATPAKLIKIKKPSRRSSANSGTLELIKIRIICPSSRIIVYQTDVNKRLSELKKELILELADELLSMHFVADPRSLEPRFRLIRADYQGLELNENQTLAQLGIGNNESLVLVAKRQYLQQIVAQTRETRTPSDVEIDLATQTQPARTELPMVDINEIFQQSNLQFDVRKVLISLAQSSAVVIGAGPYANRLIAMLKQKLVNKRNLQNDTLQCLVDMGFKKEKAEYALKINNNVYSGALEFLIQRQSEETTIEEMVMGIPRTSSISSPSGIICSSENQIENTIALLEIVRIYSHRDIPPSADTVSDLVEMGFEEANVIEALKKTCNNKAAACDWLCGNRTGSLVELREGLAQDSPILKAILELPQVQLNLSNPKILLAFLAVLENENTIRVWGGNDNDTTSVITHILQKYHEEKHVLGINQFYGNR